MDLVEKERLESNARITLVELSKYRDLVASLEAIDRNRVQQLELTKSMVSSLEVQLKAEKEKKAPGFSWKTFIWGLLSGAAAGAILVK